MKNMSNIIDFSWFKSTLNVFIINVKKSITKNFLMFNKNKFIE